MVRARGRTNPYLPCRVDARLYGGPNTRVPGSGCRHGYMRDYIACFITPSGGVMNHVTPAYARALQGLAPEHRHSGRQLSSADTPD